MTSLLSYYLQQQPVKILQIVRTDFNNIIEFKRKVKNLY